MIINLDKFIAEEKSHWTKLEAILDRLAKDPYRPMDLAEIKYFHYLYQRTSADLARIMTFSAEPQTRRYLESLVERAYGEIHETRTNPLKLSPWSWLKQTLPQTFRRHLNAFWLALAVTVIGVSFGGFALSLDPDAKDVIMPWSHLRLSPAERVAQEESADQDRLAGHKTTFSSFLMTHNTKVSILTMALGLTWGIGTIIMLFYNGVILGAVALDYILGGQTKFLLGWLLPHGVVEIPAILVAGQAGLVLAGAIIGWGRPVSMKTRLREVSGDLMTLIFGVAVFLIWAGIVEAFLSQYHEPIMPYDLKIGFGLLELILLFLYLWKSGLVSDRRARP
ncbi:MAG: stage II sporulation protein M [Deltaproteobacteria bacterium]|nr:stage II sporulation protein M [Deltaproteobacteria bacterium]